MGQGNGLIVKYSKLRSLDFQIKMRFINLQNLLAIIWWLIIVIVL